MSPPLINETSTSNAHAFSVSVYLLRALVLLVQKHVCKAQGHAEQKKKV